MTIRGAAAAAQNTAAEFMLEASSTASALGIQNPLADTMQYMRHLQLETKQPGWDFERGRPVGSQAWRRARTFLEMCLEQFATFPVPDVSASGDGYVHLVWFANGRRALVEMDETHAHWTVLSAGEPFVEENVDLRAAMDKLRGFFRGE